MLLIPIQDKEPGKDYEKSALVQQSVSGRGSSSTQDVQTEGSDLNGSGSD